MPIRILIVIILKNSKMKALQLFKIIYFYKFQQEFYSKLSIQQYVKFVKIADKFLMNIKFHCKKEFLCNIFNMQI
jgi:hypothetical protein